MKLKEEKKELDDLLKSTTTADNTIDASIDENPEELQEKPLFVFKYNKENKKYHLKARKSVERIVEAIVKKPEYIKIPFVQDKIEQDTKQLGNLYYQQAMILAVEQSNVESIRKGNGSPRMYETFTFLSKTYTDISNQISDFEISIKNNYSKIKFDLMDDINYDNTNQMKVLESNSPNTKNIFFGTGSIIDDIKNEKIKSIKSKNDKGNLLPDAGGSEL